MAKETLSPHEVRLTLLNTKPVFQCLGKIHYSWVLLLIKASVFPCEGRAVLVI